MLNLIMNSIDLARAATGEIVTRLSGNVAVPDDSGAAGPLDRLPAAMDRLEFATAPETRLVPKRR